MIVDIMIIGKISITAMLNGLVFFAIVETHIYYVVFIYTDVRRVNINSHHKKTRWTYTGFDLEGFLIWYCHRHWFRDIQYFKRYDRMCSNATF